MGSFPAGSFWTRLAFSQKSTATLVGGLASMAGVVCAAQTAHPNTLAGLNLGTVNVGSTSATGTVTFTFDAGGTLDSAKPFQVVTQGAPNLDFVSAAGSTCNGTTSYGAGDTCQVSVSFHPNYPGPRYGAVLLYGSAGSVIATAYVYGTGAGPLFAFSPGAISAVSAGDYMLEDVATDASGDVFVLNQNGSILKYAPSDSGYVQTTVAQIGVNGYAYGIAVDGAGNIFATLAGHVYEESPSGAGYTQSVAFGGLGNSQRIAVDGSGDVFVTESNPSKVIKAVLTTTGYTHSAINTTIGNPYAITLDESGDVYVANGGGVYKLTLSGGGYTQSTVTQGGEYGLGIAVDAAGDVYFSSTPSDMDPAGSVSRATPSPSGYILTTIVTGLVDVGPVELSPNGDLYFVNNFDSGSPFREILKVPLASPSSLTFAATANGSVSANSPQPVMVMNIGNSPLIFPIPESGDNPSISANFTLDSGSTGDCPLTSSGSGSPGTLASGASCLLLINFEPESPAYGYVDGTLKFTDNALNAASPGYAAQTFEMTGRVPGAPPFGNLATPVDSVSGTNPVSQADSVLIKGWVADPVGHAPMKNVGVVIDGKSVGRPTMGYARPTVAETYGKADLDSGYQMLYPASSLSVGTHQVTVITVDFGGNSTTFGPVSFTVAAAPAK